MGMNSMAKKNNGGRFVSQERAVASRDSAPKPSPFGDVPFEELDEAERFSVESLGRLIAGRYRLDHVVGVGGMGAVFEAVDLQEGSLVAVKILLPRHSHDKQLSARFLREARAMSTIGHPNVVQVLDSGVEGETHYLVFELLRGMDLGDAMAADELKLGELWQIAVELLDALGAIHERNVVHRDIKPENIFLAKRPGGGFQVKILDFGIAKHEGISAVQEKLTVTGTVLGTPHYMSPEQAAGSPVDGRSDLWSVGALLFRALCGFPPYDADNYNLLISRILTELPPRLRDVRPDLPELFCRAVDGVLRIQKEERWSDARTMQRALAGNMDLSGIVAGESADCPFPWAELHRTAEVREAEESIPDFDDVPTQASIPPFMDDSTMAEFVDPFSPEARARFGQVEAPPEDANAPKLSLPPSYAAMTEQAVQKSLPPPAAAPSNPTMPHAIGSTSAPTEQLRVSKSTAPTPQTWLLLVLVGLLILGLGIVLGAALG